MTQSLPDSISLICPSCGYDLRGISSERCPECGTSFDRASIAVSTIPWEHRKAIGGVKAYCRTLILATFRIRKLAEEINRPVSIRDASGFRWITVGIAAALPIAVFVAAVVHNGGTGFLDFISPAKSAQTVAMPPKVDLVLPFAAGETRWIVPPLAMIIWLGMISGVASYWFSPRNKPDWQRQRAVALSLYASAPLALLGVFIAVVAGAELLQIFHPYDDSITHITNAAAIAAAMLSFLLLLWLEINLTRLMKLALHGGTGRTVSFAVCFQIICYLMAYIALGVFPWVVGFIWLMIRSLR
jgi:hypothetical protein